MFQQDQPKSYMQELDAWTERVVIDQLIHAYTYGPEEAIEEAKRLVKKAIREKVLESYHNGQQARPQSPYQRATEKRTARARG